MGPAMWTASFWIGLLLAAAPVPAATALDFAAGRDGASLNGRWHVIIDPYENGYYDYRQSPRARIARQFRPQPRFGSDQQHADAVMARRLQRSFNLRLRRLVGPHRIECDYARHERNLGLLFDLNDFAALVGPALRAGAVRHFPLMAVRTLRQRVLRQ